MNKSNKKSNKKYAPKFNHMIKVYKFTNIAAATLETYPYRAIFCKSGGVFYKRLNYMEDGKTKVLINLYTIPIAEFEATITKLKSLTNNVLVYEKEIQLDLDDNVPINTPDDTYSVNFDDAISVTSNIAKYEQFGRDFDGENLNNQYDRLII